MVFLVQMDISVCRSLKICRRISNCLVVCWNPPLAVKWVNYIQQRDVMRFDKVLSIIRSRRDQIHLSSFGSAVSSHSRVWGEAVAAKAFLVYFDPQIVSGGNDFRYFCWTKSDVYAELEPPLPKFSPRISTLFMTRPDRDWRHAWMMLLSLWPFFCCSAGKIFKHCKELSCLDLAVSLWTAVYNSVIKLSARSFLWKL